MSELHPLPPRTALFLPASNARAIEKARGLAVDLVILDLEDAVREADKDASRAAAVAASASFGAGRLAIRINGTGHPAHGADMIAVRDSAAAFVVLPKAETIRELHDLYSLIAKQVLAMIETPRGVLAAAAIAAERSVAGLVAGTNDLAVGLRLPPGARRASLAMALQTIVLAARAHGKWAIDGVFNGLEDPAGLESECREGRALGFDGKSLIHPNQIDIAAAAFAPSDAEVAAARALIESATGGAERFEGRMIEAMHVAQARAVVGRARP